MKQRIVNRLIRAGSFCTLGILIFFGIQTIFTKKWVYADFYESPADQRAELDQIVDTADIQALFLGSSHSEYAVSPMEIYKLSGITLFNLSSSAQPLPVSYFFCEEMFKEQDPQIVLLDVSMLFERPFSDVGYRIALDLAPLSGNKAELAMEYASHYPTEKQIGSFVGAFLPMYQYHDRWVGLTCDDFMHLEVEEYYRKGYFIRSGITATSANLDWSDGTAQQLAENIGWYHIIEDGTQSDLTDMEVLYQPTVDETSLSYLLKIKQLCEENHAKLVLIKIPVWNLPQYYAGTWTRLRSDAIKELAAEHGLEFLDLLYDHDPGIDWARDSLDGGNHLNILGAKKVSRLIADYLVRGCRLVGSYDQTYEEDLPLYDAICRLCELQTTSGLSEYLTQVRRFDDVTVFFSVADDMMSNLSAEDRRDLNDFGLVTDFDLLDYSDAFAAVKEGDRVRYEASSNRKLSYSGTLENGSTYTVTSCGWLVGSESTIAIDGMNYSLNRRGINIVVLDNASGLVLDSVAFDTWNASGSRSAIRNNTNIGIYLHRYEQYLTTQDAENGIGG